MKPFMTVKKKSIIICDFFFMLNKFIKNKKNNAAN